MNFQMFKLSLKAMKPDIKLLTSVGSSDKQESSRKTSTVYFCFIDLSKAFDYVEHNKLWKILQERWEYQTTLPASWEICMQVKKQQLKPDMEQWNGSNRKGVC